MRSNIIINIFGLLKAISVQRIQDSAKNAKHDVYKITDNKINSLYDLCLFILNGLTNNRIYFAELRLRGVCICFH